MIHSEGARPDGLNPLMREELGCEKLASLEKELWEASSSTWRAIGTLTFPNSGLMADRIDLSGLEKGEPLAKKRVKRYTSPTNIGLGLISSVVARDLGFISSVEAREKLQTAIDSLLSMDRLYGFYFNWYDPANRDRIEQWPQTDSSVSQFLSSVDNAWLVAALLVIKTAEPSLEAWCDEILKDMDFSFFYDPITHTFKNGYTADEREISSLGQKNEKFFTPNPFSFSERNYGLLYSESRLISYLAIILEQVSPEHWFYLLRTPELNDDMQMQRPEVIQNIYNGVPVLNGYYRGRDGIPIVPSPVGAAFEAWSTNMFFDESVLAPNSLGLNNRRILREQAYCINQSGIWGRSTGDTHDGYAEMGVDSIACWRNEQSLTHPDYVNPAASFMAMPIDLEEALENLARIREIPNTYDERYGFTSSVNTKTREAVPTIHAPDVGWNFAFAGNALGGNVIHDYMEPHLNGFSEILRLERFYPE